MQRPPGGTMAAPEPPRRRRLNRTADRLNRTADRLNRTAARLNRTADRAGRYRRVGIGLVMLALPLIEMGVASLLSGRRTAYGLGHLAVAGSCLWLATDLTQAGSLIDDRSWPHRSVPALATSTLLVGALRPAGFSDGFGLNGWAAPALITLALALLSLGLADRRRDIGASLVGRSLLVVGGSGLGVVALVRTLRLVSAERSYAAGMAALAAVLTVTVVSEAKLLARAAALLRIQLRREPRI